MEQHDITKKMYEGNKKRWINLIKDLLDNDTPFSLINNVLRFNDGEEQRALWFWFGKILDADEAGGKTKAGDLLELVGYEFDKENGFVAHLDKRVY